MKSQTLVFARRIAERQSILRKLGKKYPMSTDNEKILGRLVKLEKENTSLKKRVGALEKVTRTHNARVRDLDRHNKKIGQDIQVIRRDIRG